MKKGWDEAAPRRQGTEEDCLSHPRWPKLWLGVRRQRKMGLGLGRRIRWEGMAWLEGAPEAAQGRPRRSCCMRPRSLVSLSPQSPEQL